MATQAPMADDKARFWVVPELQDLECLEAHYVRHSFSPHIHDGYALGVIEQGAQTVDFGRDKVVMPAGSVCTVNPCEVHTGRATTADGWRYRMMYPDADLVSRAASELADRDISVPMFPQRVVADPRMAAAMVNLFRILDDDRANALEKETALLLTLAELIRRHGEAGGGRPRGRERKAVRTARELLDASLRDNVSLDALAQATGLSRFHLCRVFRDAVGMPPHAYLTARRVTAARDLLKAGTSIADVAVETGFHDQSHLTRHFKKALGITPGAYRRQVSR